MKALNRELRHQATQSIVLLRSEPMPVPCPRSLHVFTAKASAISGLVRHTPHGSVVSKIRNNCAYIFEDNINIASASRMYGHASRNC